MVLAEDVKRDLLHELVQTSLHVVDEPDPTGFGPQGSVRRQTKSATIQLQIVRSFDGHRPLSRDFDELSMTDGFSQAASFAQVVRTFVKLTVLTQTATESDRARNEHIKGVVQFVDVGQQTGGNWLAVIAEFETLPRSAEIRPRDNLMRGGFWLIR